MPRSQYSARNKAKKRLFRDVKGYRNKLGKNYRLAKEARVRALCNALAGRRRKKRDFRQLWIIRLSAACRARGIRYSQFIYAMKMAQVIINRKMLSELAIHDPAAFDAVVETARKAL
ncbi:MAG: 50S ribosomal protein L20 [Sedimentisphaerales bacterium]|nr:50S ribosomal protein L20 [Sedimentisphaerales bacterium]MBN2843780.1 50S ribosomal protein L20 [Sedimentisphaerales bacterium]